MSFFAQRRSAVLLTGVVVLFALSFCNGESGGGSAVAEAKNNTGNFKDSRDGKTYKSIKMPDGKTWMGENLNYETGNSWCYGGDNSNCEKYGRLYDWKTAKTACPSGWHLPSREEWRELAKAAGGTGTYGDGGIAGRKLKSTSGWNNNGNGTDEFGFSALPGGRHDADGSFDIAGNYGIWWTDTELGGYYAYYRYMCDNCENVIVSSDVKSVGFSVRCVKN